MTRLNLGSNDTETLRDVTKDEIVSLFLSHVHPSSTTRSKLSVHLQSRKPRPKHVSQAAANAFACLLSDAGISIDNIGWKEEVMTEGEPTIVTFTQYWKTVLASEPDEITDKLLAALPELVGDHVATADAHGTLCGAQRIDDVKAFKSTLTISKPPCPLVDWNDLPRSKF